MTVKGENAKSGRSRFIPLTKELKSFFKTATFNYNHNINKGFVVALRKANIKDFRFHDLRHTYASNLVRAGVSLYVVKELLGHKTLEMTQRYAHLAKETLKKAMDTLGKATRAKIKYLPQ